MATSPRNAMGRPHSPTAIRGGHTATWEKYSTRMAARETKESTAAATVSTSRAARNGR